MLTGLSVQQNLRRVHDTKTELIFATGHALEEVMLKHLKKQGWRIERTQARFEHVELSFSGHIDGVLTATSEAETSVPCILEMKSMNDRNFTRFKDEGAEHSHPHYVDQVHVYMHHLRLTNNPAILCAINKNNCEMHSEKIEYSQHRYEAIVARLQQAKAGVDRKVMPPRMKGASPENWHCRYCEFNPVCYDTL